MRGSIYRGEHKLRLDSFGEAPNGTAEAAVLRKPNRIITA
jgi:hypothetical protein